MRDRKAQSGFSAVLCCLGIGLLTSSSLFADPGGAALAHPCLTCHATAKLEGSSVPDLYTLARKDFKNSIAEFREFPEDFVVMGRIIGAYTDEELIVIMDYFSAHRGAIAQ